MFDYWVSSRMEFTDEDRRACIDTVVELAVIADLARKESILSLEDKIEQFKDKFLRIGLQLAIDAVEPDVIRSTMQRYLIGGNYRGRDLLRCILNYGRHYYDCERNKPAGNLQQLSSVLRSGVFIRIQCGFRYYPGKNGGNT